MKRAPVPIALALYALSVPLAGGRGAADALLLRFTDVSETSGIRLVNVCGAPVEKQAIPESLGQGAAALDYDGDGRLDLYIANGGVLEGGEVRPGGRSALYRNEGEFRFRDVSREAGLDIGEWVVGATVVDFDADGRRDLYLTLYFGPNRFFRNRGNGTFEDATAAWGGADRGPSTAAAFFDAEGDGDLDLYVANYVAYDPRDPPNGGEPCRWRGFPVFCGPWGTIPAADSFFRNDGGRLVEASAELGFGAVRAAYGLGAVTGDFDNDGDVDLYVANDSVPNFLFENLGGGRFREGALEYGAASREDGYPQAGMGVDFGDVDNDGRFELFVTNFANDTNTLYLNEATPSGRTMFSDATSLLGLAGASYAMLSWGTRIADLDLDGWPDIVVASGHIYPQADRPGIGSSYAQPNQLFLNLGSSGEDRVSFREIGAELGEAFTKRSSSRGMLTADLDDDGDLDLLFVEMAAPPTVLRNETAEGRRWIGFELRGAGANREAIGARLAVEDARGVLRWRERSGGGSYLSSSDPRQLFGLGSAEGPIRKVTVRWPSGETSVHENLEIGRYWILDEASMSAAPVERRGGAAR